MMALRDRLPQMIEMRRSGMTLNQMAKQIHYSAQHIGLILNANGILRRREDRTDVHPEEFIQKARALWDKGLTMSQIGKRLGVNKDVISGIKHRNKFPRRK